MFSWNVLSTPCRVCCAGKAVKRIYRVETTQCTDNRVWLPITTCTTTWWQKEEKMTLGAARIYLGRLRASHGVNAPISQPQRLVGIRSRKIQSGTIGTEEKQQC